MMRSFAFLSAAAATLAVAHSKEVTETAPPMGVYKTEVSQALVTATTIAKEDSVSTATAILAVVKKRDVSCVAQPTGISHIGVDTAAGFLADAYYPAQASAAVVPSGYSSIYVNSQASNNADQYMGYTLMDTYDVKSCGDRCSAMDGCSSFNVYFERDPAVNPDSSSCSNPAGVTQIKCVWWGGIIDKSSNVNSGQWRNQFQVVIAGSNAYVNQASASIAATYVSSAPAAATTVANANSNYAIYFSSDSTVGSFGNAQASTSYADCTTACDNTVSCTAFTYVGGANGIGSGTCWLKGSLGSPSKSGSNVVSGVKIVVPVVNKAASTTSTTSSTAQASSSSSSNIHTTSTSAAASSTTVGSATSSWTTSVKASSAASSSTSPTTAAVTTGAPFYIKIGDSRNAYSAQWAAVAAGVNGAVTLNGSALTGATKFAYDSTGKMIVYGTTNAANIQNTNGAYKGLVANPAGQSLPFINCGGDDMISCSANGANQLAAVCTSDNYKTLYFGSNAIPNGCFWVGLFKFPV